MAEFLLLLFSFFGLVGFIFAGVEDYKFKRVSTIISSTLWLILFVIGSAYNKMYFVAIGVFALTFFTNTLNAIYKKQPMLGWGDVLLFPVFCAFVIQLMPNTFISFIIIAAAMLFDEIKYIVTEIVFHKRDVCLKEILSIKTGAPLVSYMAVAYCIAFLCALL